MRDKRPIGLLRKSAKKYTEGEKTQQKLPLFGRLTFYSARRYRHVASILVSSLRLHDIPMNKMDRWMDIWIDECTLFFALHSPSFYFQLKMKFLIHRRHRHVASIVACTFGSSR